MGGEGGWVREGVSWGAGAGGFWGGAVWCGVPGGRRGVESIWLFVFGWHGLLWRAFPPSQDYT